MSFIQVQQSLVTQRKTLRLARLLGMDRYATVGRLVALWSWSLDIAVDGVFGDDIDAEVVADVMGYDASMGRPAEQVDALTAAVFLDVDPSDQRLHIHGWHEHMGRLIERREGDADRKRRQREREREGQSGETAVTSTPAADGRLRGAVRLRAATLPLRLLPQQLRRRVHQGGHAGMGASALLPARCLRLVGDE